MQRELAKFILKPRLKKKKKKRCWISYISPQNILEYVIMLQNLVDHVKGSPVVGSVLGNLDVFKKVCPFQNIKVSSYFDFVF